VEQLRWREGGVDVHNLSPAAATAPQAGVFTQTTLLLQSFSPAWSLDYNRLHSQFVVYLIAAIAKCDSITSALFLQRMPTLRAPPADPAVMQFLKEKQVRDVNT
jgi:hypothetical protein